MNFEDLENEFLNLMKKPVKVEPPKKYKLTPEELRQKIINEELELQKDLQKLAEKNYNKKIKKGKIEPSYVLETVFNQQLYQRNKTLYNALLHTIQIEKVIKMRPNQLYTHEVKFYKNGKVINDNAFNLNEKNPFYEIQQINLLNRYWKFTRYTKEKEQTIRYNLTVGSFQYWIPEVLLGDNNITDDNYYTVITTKAYPKFVYDQADNNQFFRNNDTGSCFYDGILNYFNSKYDKNQDKNAKSIINKLIKNEDKYKKGYNLDDIKLFCEEFKISITIRNLITGDDIEINKNKFNKFSVEFMNTKYNHLDLLMNTYNNIEEVELKDLDEIKKNTSFYIESFGKVITLDKTYTKKKTDFEKVFFDWADKYNINKLSIYKESNEYKLINEYDYNLHRFFKNYSGEEKDYKEIDIKSAYYNYSKIEYNKHYLGLPTGSFISHSCDNKFTIDTLKEQVKNKLVGYYQVEVKNIKKNEKNLDVLGFGLNSIHVLYTPTILLLSDYVEFNFLNASFSRSVHIPFDESLFMYSNDKKELVHKKDGKINYYVKASGCLFKDSDDINIVVKPLNEDIEFYKTFYNENYSVFYEDGLYNISINNLEKKSKIHLINSIHAYTTTLILENLLKMDIDKVLGVKLDSIVIDSDYNFDYDKKIFSDKKAKLSGMFCGVHALSLEFEDFKTEEDYERYIELNNFDCIDKYKTQSNNILDFPKIFTPNEEYIVKPICYFGGIGGSGKTHTILKNLNNKNICFTSKSWDLIQGKQKENNSIIGLSIPKITGYCNGQKVEQIKNNNIRYIVIDEMTLIDTEEVENIINLFKDCFIFLLGDVSEDGFPYQCCINENQIYKPNEKTQYIKFTKTYRFNEELNDKLLKLRKNQYENKDLTNRTNTHLKYFKELFSDRFFDVKDINFNIDDVGISTHDDTKKENALTNYFLENEKAQPQYYIKKTNIHNGQLRGQKLDAKPTHSNFECKLFKTIHAYQGRELTLNNKLIVFLGGLHDYNLLYTAVSRARRTDQIYIFDKY
jgi:hypothetical protein